MFMHNVIYFTNDLISFLRALSRVSHVVVVAIVDNEFQDRTQFTMRRFPGVTREEKVEKVIREAGIQGRVDTTQHGTSCSTLREMLIK